MRKLVLGLALMLAGALPEAARASCASPRPFFAPTDGSILPANPVVFLFVPGFLQGDEIEIELDVANAGRSTSSWSDVVSESPAFRTYRIEIAAPAGSELRVQASFRINELPLYAIESRYRVADVEPPDAGPAIPMKRPQYEHSSWTCSYQSTWNLTPQVDAPAYRVEWAPTKDAYQARARETIVVPGRMNGFWRPYPGRSEGPALVQLGHLDCMDHTMVWPGAHIWVGVWALLPDGSEIALTDAPIRLTKPLEG